EALTLKTGIRLMAFYKPIIDTIHNEIHVEKTLLENINLLISIQESAELVGCHVAAKVSDDAMASEEWILASVVGVVNGKIEVEDIEPEEDQKTKQHHFVNPKFVLVIPNDNLKRYPKGHQVLALYPASSCFYRATVLLAPEHVCSLFSLLGFD
ncbi:SGF29 tudor-like domain-containing protein, partial [Globomyces pollinis-pini]